MAVGTFKTMQHGILKRAILDFRWFYALKATPNRGFAWRPAFKTMQKNILKRAILDFRWFYALKATPNLPVGSC